MTDTTNPTNSELSPDNACSTETKPKKPQNYNDPRKHIASGTGARARRDRKLKDRTLDKLNPRQEQFCQLYSQHKLNNAECARRSGYSQKHAKIVANRLLKNPNIKRRIREIELEAGERNRVTLDEVISNLRTTHEAAFSSGSYAAAVRATELLGRYIGMFTDKVKVNHLGAILQTNDPDSAARQFDRFQRISNLVDNPTDEDAENRPQRFREKDE